MRHNSIDSTRVLVVIASYGHANDKYLFRLVEEYQSMPFPTDIVVCSNLGKPDLAGVEVVVGLPSKDPWSLPFVHKKLFAERIDDYDLFIYSENDTLITEQNIRAFLRASTVVKENELPSFFRYECGSDGQRNYPEEHGHFHWDPQSVVTRGGDVFAFFTCEHSACYAITQRQLQRAIDSGGFLVPPHRGKYDLACTAATDPYTQCGFRKLVCISSIDDFLVHHLPNKYIGTRFGTDDGQFRGEIDALLKFSHTCEKPASLFNTETRLADCAYSKDYREPVRPEIVSIISKGVGSVLSIGCGTGATEAYLANRGLRVTAAPLDPIIPGRELEETCELVLGDLQKIRSQMCGRQYDCLLLMNVLHLVDDPVALLSSFGAFLSGPSAVVIVVPNMSHARLLWSNARRGKRTQDIGSYQESGVHRSSHGIVREWCRQAGIEVGKITDVIPAGKRTASKLSLHLLDPLLSSEIIAVGERRTPYLLDQANMVQKVASTATQVGRN